MDIQQVMTEISEEKVLVAPEMKIKQRKGEFFLLCSHTGRWFKTSELGKEFIERCNGSKSFQDLCIELAREKGVQLPQVRMLLQPFYASLLREGFIQEATTYTPSPVTHPWDISLDGLSSVWLHGTLRCNLQCFFCYSNSGPQPSQELTAADVERLVAQIPHPERVGFQISGGEPFLWTHRVEALKAIKAAGGRVTLLTNGTLGSLQDYQEIAPYVDLIQFSIDGVSAETHDLHRGTGTFARAMERVALARQAGVKAISFSFTPSIHNISDLPAMLDLTVRLGGISLHVNRLMPVGRGQETRSTYAISDEAYLSTLDQLIAKYQEYVKIETYQRAVASMKVGYDVKKQKPFIDLDIAGDQSRKVAISGCRTNCGTASMLSIDCDGSVYTCPSLHLPELRLGNLRENSLPEIWEARTPFLHKTAVDTLEKCQECEYRYICGGGCRALTYGVTGDVCALDPLCAGMKRSIEQSIWALQVAF